MSIPVLYDGWALVRAPDSPEALHLAALLANLPPDVKALIALPEDPPDWLSAAPVHIQPEEDTPLSRLNWEQSDLPRLARRTGARLLHLTAPTPPLFGKPISLISPSNFEFGYPVEPAQRKNFGERARAASALGGLSRARAILWPADLPAPDLGNRILMLPPVTLSTSPAQEQLAVRERETNGKGSKGRTARLGGITRPADLNLPETYILYHGPGDEAALRQLLDAWSWAAGAVSEYHPLLLLGLDGDARDRLERLVYGTDLGESLRVLPPVAPVLVAHIYQGCSALFHPARTPPWGSPIRQALAQGKPVVAYEDERSGAIAGPAAYLLPQGDARSLGAALITVIVEEQVAESLMQAGLERAAAWGTESFSERLLQAYQVILGEK